MLDRRDALIGIAGGLTLAASVRVSASEPVDWEKDRWGNKLAAYFKSGDHTHLRGMFRQNCSLVAFEQGYILTSDSLVFEGQVQVINALQGLRAFLLKERSGSGPRHIREATLDGPRTEGQMNRLMLVAANIKPVETCCGPESFEDARQIFYQAGIYPGIERMAVLPPFYADGEPAMSAFHP